MLSRRGRTLLVAGLGAVRLGELAWSARNERRAGPGRAAARRSYPAMVAVHAALFVVCLRAAAARRGTRDRRWRPAVDPGLEAVAMTGLAGALLLRLWVIGTLGTAWNVRAVVPERMRVVHGGPYRWVRHPNYVAVAVEFACLPVAVGAYREAVLLSAANALVLVPRIRGEERLLEAVPGYHETFAGVPRFVPRCAPSPGRHPGG